MRCARIPLGAEAWKRPEPDTGWKPTRNVEIVVPTSAGTGGEYGALRTATADRKAIEVPVIVVNKPGRAANIGLIYLTRKRVMRIAIRNTAALLSNPTGKARLTIPTSRLLPR
jgi:tripartite-type tricarboxylate transporter receptor subunit TctC